MKTAAKDIAGSEEPFFAAVNGAECVTTSVVLEGRAPARFVWHDDVTGQWHFHEGGPVDRTDRVTVAIAVVLAMDATLGEISDLELGMYAERLKVGAPWSRRRRPMDEID